MRDVNFKIAITYYTMKNFYMVQKTPEFREGSHPMGIVARRRGA